MLRLRLTEGLREADYRRRFGKGIPVSWRAQAQSISKQSGPALLVCDSDGIRLTRQGFLLSNAIIARILG